MRLRDLLAYLARHKREAVLATVSALLAALVGVYAPLVARQAVNLVVSMKWGSLPPLLAAFIALTAAQGLFAYIQGVSARKLSEGIAFDLRVELYRKLHDLSLPFIHRQGAGGLVARITGDVEQVKSFFEMLTVFLGGSVLVVFSVAAMLAIDAQLALLTLAILLALPLLPRKLAPRIRRLFDISREQYARMSTILQETIVSIIPVRAVNAAEYMLSRFSQHNKAFSEALVEAGRYRALLWPTLNLLNNIAVAVILLIGGWKISAGSLTVGDLTALTMYAGMISWPITQLGFVVVSMERARVALSRVHEVLSAKPDVEEAPDAAELRVTQGRVEFRDVWFSYDGQSYVLRGVSFEVKPGEIVAITGPPGCGKSTLAGLLIRLADPQRGVILIDGQDVRRVKLESLRRNVTIVHQDIYLFPDTIRNNIAFAKPEASEEEVVEAARLAHIHDFISSLPQGYDTPVGERGVTLSGGQRQRVALARALLARPRVIVLDDTTSEVDAETERAIYDALTRNLRGHTIIVITQRPSTMALADRVLVMDSGRIVAELKPKVEVAQVWRGGTA
uniref:ABC transporter ATP-binding protein n=1 Tax=Thermofilum pendens TaxID=2269 RepID=A0A7C4BAH7_THEPE